jgi:type II secretory pathway component PulK
MTQVVDKSETKESGFALFIVLSFLLIAAAITTPFLASARIEALVSRNIGQSTRDKVLLQGLLDMAALRYFELYQNTQTRPVRHVECQFSGLALTFNFQDHSGLIDLNAASADVLAMGLQSFGYDAGKAKAVSNEIVRYRSVDSGTGPQGSVVPPRNGYKHSLFEHVSELNDLLVPAELSILKAGAVFTVHSGTGTVDEAAAPDQLLAEIDNRPVTDRYFVVNDTRRTNAVTVSSGLQKFGIHQTTAEAIVGRGENGLGIRSFGPTVFETKPQNQQTGTTANRMPCEAFFDAPLLQAIREVTS